MLKGMRILFVEDDDDSRDLIAMLLSAQGADVREVRSGEEAIDVARGWTPDVVLADLKLPGMDGVEALRQLRSIRATLPAIALTGSGTEMDRHRSLEGGFEKHLLKPAAARDIVAALALLVKPAQPTPDVREMLSVLNASGSCQYTSVLRFAKNGTLISVWTYDRTAPTTDGFALALPIEASYCVLVRDAAEVVMVENAPADPRTLGHPKRDQLAAYMGVPIFDAGGIIFGTLCSYDVAPQRFSEAQRDQHEAAAKQLSAIVSRWE